MNKTYSLKLLIVLILMFTMTILLTACNPFGSGGMTDSKNHTLTVNITGGGKLTPSEGTYEYNEVTKVNLEATPDENYGFNVWKGDIGAVEEKRKFEKKFEILVDGNKEITGVFREISLTGTILANRGGSSVSDAEIIAYEEGTENIAGIAKSDDSGEFKHALPSGTYDIVAKKDGHAASKLYSVNTEQNFNAASSIIMKEIFDESKEAVPPEISVEGIDNGEVIDNNVEIEITAEAEYPIQQVKIRLGHQGDYNEYSKRPNEKTWNEKITISPENLPAGEGYIEISLYDMQHNRAVRLIPVSVEGSTGADLAKINDVYTTAITFGEDLGLFLERQEELAAQVEDWSQFERFEKPGILKLDDREIDLNEIKQQSREDITLYVDLSWSYISGADSYYVYRAWNEDGSYEQIATVSNNYLYDFDGELKPGKDTYYKIAPVAPDGEKGPESDPVMVTPLEQFEINLETPKNGAQGVSLVPTLSWEANEIGDEQWYEGWVIGSTDNYPSWYFYKEGITEIEYNNDGSGVELQPEKEYRWDILYGEAIEEFPNYVNSLAISIAGASDGSSNGEFTFVTSK